jgi:hypothetical protein
MLSQNILVKIFFDIKLNNSNKLIQKVRINIEFNNNNNLKLEYLG